MLQPTTKDEKSELKDIPLVHATKMNKERDLYHKERENVVTPSPLPPRLKKDTFKKDKSKYCDYHKDQGHDTKQCVHLKKKIKDLMRQGNLKNFIQRQVQGGKKFKRRDNRNQGRNNKQTNNF